MRIREGGRGHHHQVAHVKPKAVANKLAKPATPRPPERPAQKRDVFEPPRNQSGTTVNIGYKGNTIKTVNG